MSRTTFVLLVLGLVIALFLQFRPLDDVDVFWQVQTGRQILQTRQLVTQDQFTYTHAGEPVPPIAWLSQVLFALQLQWGGWAVVRTGAALAMAGALCVMGAVRRREVGWFSLCAAVVVGLLVALPHGSVRPQAYGIFGFALLLALVYSEWPNPLRLALAIPLLVVWQNLHPSVVVGAIAVGAIVAGKWLRFSRRRQEGAPWVLTALLALTVLSQFATPLGFSIVAISRHNAVVSRDWLHVSEWMPPWDASVRDAMGTFWVALLISLVLLARLRYRVAAEDLALFGLMTLLALSAARFALFWAIAAVPMWARWIEAAKPAGMFQEETPVSFRWYTAAPVLIAMLFFVTAIPAFLPVTFPGVPVSYLEDKLPWDGVSRLITMRNVRRIYNYREWGGPLIFFRGPYPFRQWQVAIDGRLYLFSKDEWDEYSRAALGEIPLAELIAKHRPDAFFLRPGFHTALIASLRQAPEWMEIYSDANCAVFIAAQK